MHPDQSMRAIFLLGCLTACSGATAGGLGPIAPASVGAQCNGAPHVVVVGTTNPQALSTGQERCIERPFVFATRNVPTPP